MPQMNKGGEFIFGESAIRPDGRVRLPDQAVEEYRIASEGQVYLFTGSRSTGGFCVTRKGLLLPSKLGHILTDVPGLLEYTAPEGAFFPYKGRAYCWAAVSGDGEVWLTEEMRGVLGVEPGMRLLSIRSSDIAFTMGPRGRCWKRRRGFPGGSRSFRERGRRSRRTRLDFAGKRGRAGDFGGLGGNDGAVKGPFREEANRWFCFRIGGGGFGIFLLTFGKKGV